MANKVKKICPPITARYFLIFFLFMVLSVIGCAKKEIIVPSLTLEPTQHRFTGKFVWRDLFTHDLQATSTFYQELFGWTFNDTASSNKRVKTIMLAPRLALNSVWGNQVISGELVLRGRQDIDLYDIEAVVAAGLLRQFAPVALTGSLSMQLSSLQLRDGLPHAGEGRLVWQNGGWQSPQGLLPLGSYALEYLQAPGAALEAEVLTLSGPLQASGAAQLQGRTYQVNILLGSQAPMDTQLEQALSLIAAPESGAYRLKLNGEF